MVRELIKAHAKVDAADGVSLSIIAHDLYCCTLHIHTADESVSCLCLMRHL